MSTFSFSSSGDHRDLHSFPTRRSSDLRLDIADRAREADELPESGDDEDQSQQNTADQRPVHSHNFHGLSSVVAKRSKRSEEHTSELQSHHDLVCRLLLEKKKKKKSINR